MFGNRRRKTYEYTPCPSSKPYLAQPPRGQVPCRSVFRLETTRGFLMYVSLMCGAPIFFYTSQFGHTHHGMTHERTHHCFHRHPSKLRKDSLSSPRRVYPPPVACSCDPPTASSDCCESRVTGLSCPRSPVRFEQKHARAPGAYPPCVHARE